MNRWTILVVVALGVGSLIGYRTFEPALHGASEPAAAPAVPKDLTSYRDIVKQVLPAVVSIETRVKLVSSQKPPRLPPELDNPNVPEEFRKFFEEFQKSPFEMPDQSQRYAFGSGFIVDPKGVILTNNHVVVGSNEVEVHLQDGRKFLSKEIKTDPKTDLAIIRIDAKKPLPFLELGNSDAMEIGDRVLAVGAPFGLTGSVTSGIISAKGRNLHMNMYEDFLQTDAAVNPGNSGGPLINLEGKVIGINTAIKSGTGGFQGVSLAIASNLAKNVMDQLLKNGKVSRGYLGVQVQNLDPDIASRLDLKDNVGVLVGKVFDGTPAAKAGVKDGDVITTIDGKPVKDGHDLQQIVAGLTAGKPVDVALVRDGKTETVKLTVEEQPQAFGTVSTTPGPPARPEEDTINLDKIGVKVTDMTAELAGRLGYKDKQPEGALVTKVDPSGLAAEKGLRTAWSFPRWTARRSSLPPMSARRWRAVRWTKAFCSRWRHRKG